jgi:cell cycle sensor histidine kinase DivJ
LSVLLELRTSVLGLANRAFGSLVHHSACGDILVHTRHRTFIASHVLGACLALAVFCSAFLVLTPPTAYAYMAMVWFSTPLGIAIFLSRTGRLDIAHFLSAANLIGLVAIAALMTGGIHSFALVWMVLVPLEAALSSSRTMVVSSTFAALGAIAVLYLLTMAGLLPVPIQTGLSRTGHELVSHLAAAAYAGALALSVESVHRRSEATILAERERFRLLADNATDLITLHDEKGEVVFASPASGVILGEPPAKMMGGGLLERVLVCDRPRYLAAVAEAASRGEPVAEEFRVRRLEPGSGDGPPRYDWVEMRCRPVTIGPCAGLPAIGKSMARPQVVAVTRDIAMRKVQEEALLEARNAAQQASRAKTMFLANMSHELRTPLNSIIGFSDILTVELARERGDPRHVDHCRTINESGAHLLGVVNDLLDISRIESGNYRLEPEAFEASSLVRSCVETLRPAAQKKSIELVCELPTDLPELEADRRAAKQMLLNLLANAVKFTGEGGRVRVGARVQDGQLSILVADNGPGIAKEDIARLGRPFVQAQSGYCRRHEGAGLGLSVVGGLARLHGGRLVIESEPGQGATVSFTLPVVAETPLARQEMRVLASCLASAPADDRQPVLLAS